MIKKIINSNNNIVVTGALSKVLCAFVVFFLCFNSIVSSFILNYNKSDLVEISSIQKDVFSAIFFISGTIEKINESLSDKLGLKSTSTTEKDQKNPQPVAKASSDIIIIESQSQNIKVLKNLSSYVKDFQIYGILYSPFYLLSENRILYREINFYFIVMILFFASAKKIYDNLNKINRIMYKNPLIF
ncbi:MAG: hypothetical protein WCY38_04685 [Endomicrobiia bacterium]